MVAAIGFAAFMIWELTEKNPIVNLKVFRHRGFTASMVTCLTMGAFFATNVLTPLWLQSNMGYTATWAGYITGLIGSWPSSAPITARPSPRSTAPQAVSFAFVVLACVAFWRTTFATNIGFWGVAIPHLFQGFAIPFFFVPLTGLALGAVGETRSPPPRG